MTDATLIFGVATIAAIAGAGAGYGFARMHYEGREMKNRIAKLEQAKQARNPYGTNDGLEDAMAIAHDTIWQSLDTIQYLQFRAAQIDDILKTIRTNPDKYDAEKVSKKRTLQTK